jgi:hypothetical protein
LVEENLDMTDTLSLVGLDAVVVGLTDPRVPTVLVGPTLPLSSLAAFALE